MDRFRLPAIGGATGTRYQMPTMAALLPAKFRPDGVLGQPQNAADKYLSQMLGGFDTFDDVFGGEVGSAFTNVGALAGGALADAAGDINAAAKRNGIPANLLAAIIARESTGNWARDGNRYVHLGARGYNILPYVGMTDPAVRRVGMDPRSLVGDRAGQIEAAARLIKAISQEEAAGYGWQGVANVYYSGDPTGRSTPSDSWMHGSTKSYGNDILNFWNILEPGGPSSVGASSGGGTTQKGAGFGQRISAIWGGSDMPLTQDIGLTEFSKGHLGGMYSYGSSLGVQGHAGLDYGMVPGTALYSPVSGTVIYAGGTGYYTDDRFGNRAGSGEFRLKLDNGDELILGHMQSISVRPGQRIDAGTMVGLSGTANGGHTHVEYRKHTPGSTSSGYTAIDPRTALSGSGTGMTTKGAIPVPSGSRSLGVSLGSIFGW